ncbi:MAG: class I adenylate-forming enzyme family protein [Rhizomicrobium sp.]
MSGPLPGNLPRLVRLSDYVRHHAQTAPQREAVIFGTKRLNYRELDRTIERCAASLVRTGVRRGDRIAMLTTPRAEFATMLLAAQRIGAIWVGLNPRYKLAEIEFILDDCAPALFVAVPDDASGHSYADELAAISRARPALQILSTIDFDKFLAGGDGTSAPAIVAGPEDPTVIVYTSGTTGKPKGALLAHRNLLYCYESVSRSFAGKESVRDGLRLLCNLPPNHIGCISEMLGNALIRGGTVVFAERFDPREMIDTIRTERITMIGGVPVMLQALFDHPAFADADLSSLKAIGWGGAPAPRALVQRIMDTGAHLFTNYGLTEGGAVVSATPANYDLDTLCDTVGAPDESENHKLVDDDGHTVATQVAAEIWLRGDGVFLGYWNNERATAQALTPDGWLRTGDIAKTRPDGMWVLEGRRSEMFKSGGFNVYPREIELALEDHPDIAMAAVLPVRDARYFEIGIAFVLPKPGHNPDAKAIEAFLRQRLANYKIPKRVVLRSDLPMLPIGKLDKQLLRTEAADLWRPFAAVDKR